MAALNRALTFTLQLKNLEGAIKQRNPLVKSWTCIRCRPQDRRGRAAVCRQLGIGFWFRVG